MESIEQQIASLQQNYYSQNKKNAFFKNSQKQDLAKSITQTIDINTLFSKSIYIIENTNIVYIDYPLLKTFMCEEIYNSCIDYILLKYSEAIQQYGSYEVQVNLKSFSMSAAQRYQTVIKMFSDRCNNASTNYAQIMTKMTTLNTPSMIDTIQRFLKPFIDPTIVNKIEFRK